MYRCALSKIREGVIPPLTHLLSVLLPVLLLIRICVETLRVTLISQWRYDRAAVSAVINIVPSNAMKERMVLDSRSTTLNIAKPMGSVHGAKAQDDVTSCTRKRGVGGKSDRFVENSK